MKRKSVKLDLASMTGFGPAAWDRDDSRLSIHQAHVQHGEQHHIVRRTGKHADTRDKPDTAQG